MAIPKFTHELVRNLNLLQAKELADAIYEQIAEVESTVAGFLSLRPQLKKDLPKIKKAIKRRFDDAIIKVDIHYWYDSGGRELEISVTTKYDKYSVGDDKWNSLYEDIRQLGINTNDIIIKTTNKGDK